MMMRNPDTQRGQTLPDFAIAFGIFMIAVSIAFMSTSTLFEPYQTNQERITSSNRISNQLVQTTFVSQNTRTYVLDEDCTTSAVKAFKGKSPTLYNKCYYNDTIDDRTYKEYLAISENRGVNISIVNKNDNIVTLNGTDLVFGSDIPEVAETTNSYRLVSINGNVYRLKTTTW